ncbi:MAG: flagellar hook-length control protein FliK [Candidatus Brocadiae bacterium]|nr:flagellar hook-length control protein FliK [Candidatus Brocadiia bacterium]
MQNVPIVSFSEKTPFLVCAKDNSATRENASFENFLDKEMMETTSEFFLESNEWKKVLDKIFCSLENIFSSSLEKIENSSKIDNESSDKPFLAEQDALFQEQPGLNLLPFPVPEEPAFLQENTINPDSMPKSLEFPKQKLFATEIPEINTIPKQEFSEQQPKESNIQSNFVLSVPEPEISPNGAKVTEEYNLPQNLFSSETEIEQKNPLSVHLSDAEPNIKRNHRDWVVGQHKDFQTIDTKEFAFIVNQDLQKTEPQLSDRNAIFATADFNAFQKKSIEGNPGKFFFSLEKIPVSGQAQENLSSSDTSINSKPEIETTLQYENVPSFVPGNLKVQKAILYLEKEEKKLQVNIQLQGEKLEAQFLTTDAKTVSVLESQIQNLKESLQKEGIQLTDSKVLLADGNSFSRERSQKENSKLIFFSRGKKTQGIEPRQGYSPYHWVSYPGKSKINCYT